MKAQAGFRSSKFPRYEDEEEQINPGLWGKRLREVPGLAFCPCSATSHVNVSRGIASILTGRESLRDIEVYLRTQAKRRYHMGLRCETVTRNTLSNASINPWLSTMAGSSLTNVVSACLRHQNFLAQAIA